MKNKVITRLLGGSLAVCALMCTLLMPGSRDETVRLNTASAASGSTASQISALKSDLNKIQNERSKLQSSINNAKSEKNNQLALKQQYDGEISSIVQQINTTSELIDEYAVSIEETEAEIEVLKKEQVEQREIFDEMIRMSFEYGSDDYLSLIFGSENFSDFLSRLDLISYHLTYNQSVLDDLSETEILLNEKIENLTASKKELEDYKASQEALKVELDAKSAQANNLIISLQNDQAAYEKALREVESSMKQLQSDIEELSRRLDNDGSKYTGGVFRWPLPSSYTSLSSGYEYRTNPITGKKELHNGIDIPAPANTKITACADGTVVKAAWYGGFGNCVIISHGGGVKTLYGHCNSLNVKEGQSVKAGDVVAYVGSTGMSTGNHLHLTVYEGSNTVQPLNYFK